MRDQIVDEDGPCYFTYDDSAGIFVEEPPPLKRQSKPWKCGPAAVRNAFRALGLKVGEDEISKLCGTTEAGTDEHGIIRAIKEYGYTATEYRSDSKKNAWQWLHGSLLHGEPVILCIQAWEHWVVCVGSLGDRVAIVDSSNFKYNVAELNTHVWDKDWLMYQWWNARKSVPEEESRLYAIAIGKR